MFGNVCDYVFVFLLVYFVFKFLKYDEKCLYQKWNYLKEKKERRREFLIFLIDYLLLPLKKRREEEKSEIDRALEEVAIIRIEKNK